MHRPAVLRLAVTTLAIALLAAGCEARPVTSSAQQDLCTGCHGTPGVNAAPPSGITPASSARAVGAHQVHLLGRAVSGGVPCASCHVVPGGPGWQSHIGGGEATVTFGGLAGAGGADPRWNPDQGTCSGTYCHGATLNHGGTNHEPAWTKGQAEAACGTCHGIPPPRPHIQATRCSGCHARTVKPDETIDVAGGAHVNGVLDVAGDGTCGGCHGIPPDDGAHRVHYGDQSSPPLAQYGDTKTLQDYRPTGGPVYMFGCGNCHPLDPNKHLDGVVEVELHDAAAPAGSLKARNAPAAAYAGNGGTCSGVYCHSSGQQTPVYVTTPAWVGGANPGCAGCHRNPPSYPSGGAGSATANTHVVVADDNRVLGHFLGFMGAWDGNRHGHGPSGGGTGSDSAPITCQTCHADTVDGSNAGPSGFYYLDTSGSYLPQVAAGAPAPVPAEACSSCHKPGGSPEGHGKVLPLLHVNGTRDVRFDRRQLPGPLTGYPGAPQATGTRPYWYSGLGSLTWTDTTHTLPPDATYAGGVFSATLASASYDPATKTCSNVACHLAESRGSYPLRWGTVPVGNATCNGCHRFGAGP